MAWTPICDINDIELGAGSAFKFGDLQIAIFRPTKEQFVYATENFCPYSKQNVIARGIVGESNGKAKVVSPIHKCAYYLEDGKPLQESVQNLGVFPTHVLNNQIYVDLP